MNPAQVRRHSSFSPLHRARRECLILKATAPPSLDDPGPDEQMSACRLLVSAEALKTAAFPRKAPQAAAKTGL